MKKLISVIAVSMEAAAVPLTRRFAGTGCTSDWFFSPSTCSPKARQFLSKSLEKF